MEVMRMADRIQVRKDSAANWESANPVLAQGEIGFELDSGRAKIGDGSNAWSALSYNIDPLLIQISATEPASGTFWFDGDNLYYNEAP
jgi:hypothetical protein